MKMVQQDFWSFSGLLKRSFIHLNIYLLLKYIVCIECIQCFLSSVIFITENKHAVEESIKYYWATIAGGIRFLDAQADQTSCGIQGDGFIELEDYCVSCACMTVALDIDNKRVNNLEWLNS